MQRPYVLLTTCYLLTWFTQLSCQTTSSQSTPKGKSVLWIENASTSLDSNRLRYYFKKIIPDANISVSPIGVAQKYIDTPADVRYVTQIGDVTCYIREHQDNADGSTPISAYKCLLTDFRPDKFHNRCSKPWIQTFFYDFFSEEDDDTKSWRLCIDQEKNYPYEFAKHASNRCHLGKEELSEAEYESCVLHKLNRLEFTIPKDDPAARDCKCGVDITKNLSSLKEEVVRSLGDLGPEDLEKTCANIASPSGWDIYNLIFTEGEDMNEQGSCGKSNTYCSSTVTVNGNCYFAGDVNYYLWGLANHYCFNTYSNPKYSLLSSLALVTAHRIVTKLSTNSPMNIEGRARWTKTGWDALDEINEYPAYTNQENNFPICESSGTRLLRWHLHDISSETATSFDP